MTYFRQRYGLFDCATRKRSKKVKRLAANANAMGRFFGH